MHKILLPLISMLWIRRRNGKMLTSPPVLKLLDSQGYLWLFSILVSFLPNNCHSFRITVIPSEFAILNSSWIPPYPKGEKIGRPYLRIFVNNFKIVLENPQKFSQLISNMFVTSKNPETTNSRIKSAAKCLLKSLNWKGKD